MDAGGVVVNHSDYPVSPVFSAVLAFCLGVLKKLSESDEMKELCEKIVADLTTAAEEYDIGMNTDSEWDYLGVRDKISKYIKENL